MTKTNEQAHDVVRRNLHLTPKMSRGDGAYGIPPRYCPSVETKLNRFPDKKWHNVWLEPEGLNSDIIYPNGITTCVPEEAQKELVALIPGLENATVCKPAYAIEY